MIVSQARIEANRKNSKSSTGPSEAAKCRTRANALKHGLCASVCVPETVEVIQKRALEFYGTLKPQDEVQVWMVEQAALCSIRIERCERLERRVRDKIALRAELMWDDDRRFEVEVLARSLSKDPTATVEALRRSPHGCDWMMARWAMLAYSADTQPGGWTDEQATMAFDLLATPHAFRSGRRPGDLIDGRGKLVESGNDPAAVARREIDALEGQREVVADVDEVNRALASNDLTNEGDPELRRLRRYESMLHNRLRWSLKQMTIQSPYRCADPALRPAWVVDPEAQPEPKPEPEPVPAREPEPEPPARARFDSPAPMPAVAAEVAPPPSPHRAREQRMAEARRQVALRKVWG